MRHASSERLSDRWQRPPALLSTHLRTSGAYADSLDTQGGPARPIDSIAILPFVNGDANSDTDYLADGISESISNGELLLQLGRFDEAFEHYRRALEVDPLSSAISSDLGIARYYARRSMARSPSCTRPSGPSLCRPGVRAALPQGRPRVGHAP